MKTTIDQAKKMARILSAGGLLVAASFALPASAAITEHTAKFAGCLSNNTCYVGINPPVPANASTCDLASDQVRWKLVSGGVVAPHGQEWARLATAAVLSGKKITVDVIPGTCDGGYPVIQQLHVTQ